MHLLLLAACLPKPVDKPADLAMWEWRIDRSTLPEATLRVLHVGVSRFEEHLAVPGGGGEELAGPISVYLIDHPTRGFVMIDAAFGRRTAADPGDYPGRSTAKAIGLEMGVPAADRLRELEVHPDEIKHLLVTHLHADHAGGVEDFPKATLWLSEAEWIAGAKKSFTRNYAPSAYEAQASVRTLAFDDGPYGPFPAHEDVLGDGSLVALPTPGHTPGHTSYLVNLRGGSYLLTGDAAWLDLHWQEPSPKGFLARSFVEVDWKQNMDALWRIREWAQRYPDLVVIAGHEPANAERLKPWPEAYR